MPQKTVLVCFCRGARRDSYMNAARVKDILRSFGPYVTLELFVPGGTMIALLLWLFRRKTRPTR